MPDAPPRFSLLGPLAVTLDGEPVSLGGQKRRALLATLLLEPKRVVSRDRLIDALWGEDPPDTARNTVQVYVSQLRKLLPEGMLETAPPGYRLAVEPDTVDVFEFVRLSEEGRAALAAGDAARAAETLRTALALWRGPPLADLAWEPFAQSEIVRLEELRLAALEDRIDADLALGRHGQLVSELEQLVAEHPLRERLRGQLMLALYRSGREAEALEAYQATRRALVDELGIEPSPALQQLETAILRQDPSLVASAPGPSGTVTMLFTDIEGSTRLVRELSERYAEVLATHRRIVRAAVDESGGTEIDTQGDAFFFAFPRARDAVLSAAAAQRALGEEKWPEGHALRVRMGIHTGEPGLGEEGYHGLGVVRAARICAAGHGGQVLLSEATRSLLEDGQLRDLSLRDLGEHQLKDLARAERIFQLVGRGLADDFPPLRTTAVAPPLPLAGAEERPLPAAR